MRWILAVTFAFVLLGTVVYAAGINWVTPSGSNFSGSVFLYVDSVDIRDNASFYYGYISNNTFYYIDIDNSVGKAWSIKWNTTNVSDGIYDLKVNTTIASNSSTEDNDYIVNVKIDNKPPSIDFVDPGGRFKAGGLLQDRPETDQRASLEAYLEAEFYHCPSARRIEL